MPLIEELPSDEEEAAEALQESAAAQAHREKIRENDEEAEVKRVAGQFDLAEACRAEGSALFSTGKLEEANEKYFEALRHLYKVGNKPDDRVRAEKANLVLHLNLALVGLRLEQFEAAKDQAENAVHLAGCLKMEQEHVKALYRLAMAKAGLARKAALFREEDAKGASDDLQALLRMDPANADARRELLKLRGEISAHQKDMTEKQGQFWGQVFGGKAEGEDLKTDTTLPMVRPTVDTERHCVVSAKGVAVGRSRTGPVLSDVDLNLIERWCVGIYTKDGPEKEALVNVLTRKVRPSAGTFEYPKKAKRGVNPDEVFVVTTPIMMAIVVADAAILFAAMKSRLDWVFVFILCMLSVLVVPLIIYLWYEQQCEKRPPVILHMTTQGFKHWRPSGGKTVVQVLAGCLPSKVPEKDRNSRANALMKAAGLEVEDSCLFKDLADNQKQLVYILRCLVAKVKVIICDDALRDLEPSLQSRVLRMVKRMKQDCNSSILFLSSDMQQLSLVVDSLGMLSGGKLCELGPADEVLTHPRHPDMKAAIASSNLRDTKLMDKGCSKGDGGSVVDFYNDLLKDSALGAMWLPKEHHQKI